MKSAADIIQEQKELIAARKKGKIQIRTNQAKSLNKLKLGYAKSRMRITNEIKELKPLIDSVQEGETLKILTNKFNSPSFIFAMLEEKKIEELTVASWSITPAGLQALLKADEMGIKCNIIMDYTYSHKWLYQQGVTTIFKNANFIFTESHVKFQLFKFSDGTYLTFVGSMNLSNNPRMEQIDITKQKEVFDFYRTYWDFIQEDKTLKQRKIFTDEDFK